MYWERYSGGCWGVETSRSPMEGKRTRTIKLVGFSAACSRLALCLIARTLRQYTSSYRAWEDVRIETDLGANFFAKRSRIG